MEHLPRETHRHSTAGRKIQSCDFLKKLRPPRGGPSNHAAIKLFLLSKGRGSPYIAPIDVYCARVALRLETDRKVLDLAGQFRIFHRSSQQFLGLPFVWDTPFARLLVDDQSPLFLFGNGE